jgi:hypothetical protein
MMFDAQITAALFAAFLLCMIAGSGIEIIVRGAALDPCVDYGVRRHVVDAGAA